MFRFLFSSFFSQEITKLRKYYTGFSLAKVDDQPVAFASLIHLLSEKRDWGTPLSKSLLMAIHVQAWGSLCEGVDKTWNMEHPGTFRNIPEHPRTSRNMKKIKYFLMKNLLIN